MTQRAGLRFPGPWDCYQMLSPILWQDGEKVTETLAYHSLPTDLSLHSDFFLLFCFLVSWKWRKSKDDTAQDYVIKNHHRLAAQDVEYPG